MKRLHPDLSWPAPYRWVHDQDPEAFAPLAGLEPFREAGGIVGLRGGGIELRVEAEVSGALRLQLLRPGAPSYRVDDRVLAEDREHGVLRVEEEEGALRFHTESAELLLSYPVVAATLFDASGAVLLRSTALSIAEDEGGLRARFEFLRDPSAAILGLGGRTAHPDRAGSTADMFATKGYHLRGDYGGFPIPAFLSLGDQSSFGAVLLNPHPHVYFDFGYTQEDRWSLDIPGGPIDLLLVPASGPRDWIAFLHELTGRPPLPRPQWLGTWFSWAGYSSATEYSEWVRRFAAEGIPLDVWSFDLHWRAGKIFEEDEGGDGVNLDWDAEKFADHRALLDTLEMQQVDSVLHVNTRMYSGTLAEEGVGLGYLLDAGEDQRIVDFEDPAAAEWAWQHYRERIDEGVTGWWIDNSERVEGLLGSGTPARNFYSSLWNRFLTERTADATEEPVLTLTRGGWLGDQVAALPWSGDTTAGVSRLREDLNFILNLSMTGFPFTSVDLGGFKEQKPSGLGVIDSDENVIRRIAHGFLIFPVPRLHSGLLTKPKLPWRYADPAQRLLRDFIELRHRLAPYFFSAAIESIEHAVPIARPLAFDTPEDRQARRVFDQLLLGSALLVAPVMDEGWQERRVYLPAGEWFDFWSRRRMTGGREHLVDAPLTENAGLPVFVREGGVLAYRTAGLPREGFTAPRLAFYVDARTADLHLAEQHYGSPEGGRLRLHDARVRDGLLEFELSASGEQEWSIGLDLPLLDADPVVRHREGAAVTAPLEVRAGSPLRISIELRPPERAS